MTRHTTQPRGSSLVLAMFLLAVLAVIGVAAVRLGSVERVNAAAKGRRDMLVACASAARIALWTELTRQGSGYLQAATPPTQILLPDGTELTSPSAPTGSPKDGATVADLVKVAPMNTPTAGPTHSLTNTIADSGSMGKSGSGFRVIARCRDPKQRELMVELTMKFAL